MGLVANKMKVQLPADAAVDAEIDLCNSGDVYFLRARLTSACRAWSAMSPRPLWTPRTMRHVHTSTTELVVTLRLHDVQRNVTMLAPSLEVCTCRIVRGVHNGLGDFALQARQADVKPCSEEVNVAGIAQVDFGINAASAGSCTFILLATSPSH